MDNISQPDTVITEPIAESTKSQLRQRLQSKKVMIGAAIAVVIIIASVVGVVLLSQNSQPETNAGTEQDPQQESTDSPEVSEVKEIIEPPVIEAPEGLENYRDTEMGVSFIYKIDEEAGEAEKYYISPNQPEVAITENLFVSINDKLDYDGYTPMDNKFPAVTVMGKSYSFKSIGSVEYYIITDEEEDEGDYHPMSELENLDMTKCSKVYFTKYYYINVDEYTITYRDTGDSEDCTTDPYTLIDESVVSDRLKDAITTIESMILVGYQPLTKNISKVGNLKKFDNGHYSFTVPEGWELYEVEAGYMNGENGYTGPVTEQVVIKDNVEINISVGEKYIQEAFLGFDCPPLTSRSIPSRYNDKNFTGEEHWVGPSDECEVSKTEDIKEDYSQLYQKELEIIWGIFKIKNINIEIPELFKGTEGIQLDYRIRFSPPKKITETDVADYKETMKVIQYIIGSLRKV